MLVRQFCSWLLDLVPSFSPAVSDRIHGYINKISGRFSSFIRKCIFSVLSVGPLPSHIAFILDGNRRYAKKHNLKEGDGHRVGFLALMSLLKYCCELKIKYITIYAFSIDNFRRRPEEVRYVMELMHEKIEGLLKEESVVMEYGVKVHFVGNLKLLSQSVQASIDRVMKLTAHNTNFVIVVCVAYTSTDEVVHTIQECFRHKMQDAEIKASHVERNMYMAVAPDPDILIRTSGETRLSNFLLWQTANCLLYSPSALWPELGLRHLMWTVLNFQRHHSYLEKKKKQH